MTEQPANTEPVSVESQFAALRGYNQFLLAVSGGGFLLLVAFLREGTIDARPERVSATISVIGFGIASVLGVVTLANASRPAVDSPRFEPVFSAIGGIQMLSMAIGALSLGYLVLVSIWSGGLAENTDAAASVGCMKRSGMHHPSELAVPFGFASMHPTNHQPMTVIPESVAALIRDPWRERSSGCA